jgi:hypothetical protein
MDPDALLDFIRKRCHHLQHSLIKKWIVLPFFHCYQVLFTLIVDATDGYRNAALFWIVKNPPGPPWCP